MQKPSDEARWVLRLGGASAIIGAILGGVGNLVHPVTPENDPVGVARVIADSEIWVPVHLAIVLGIALMLGGLVAVYHSIRGRVPGALARSACSRRSPAPPCGLVLGILDGVAARQRVQEWASAAPGEKITALGLV